MTKKEERGQELQDKESEIRQFQNKYLLIEKEETVITREKLVKRQK